MLTCSGSFFLALFFRIHFSLVFLLLWFQDIDINTDDELDAYIEDLIMKGE